jgi:tRNA 2-selenouridine synthase
LIADRDQADNDKSKPGHVLVHCWRGGMRSAGIAWLLDLYGFTVYTLTGGYKAYRNWVLNQFEKDHNLHVLGGYTGSGKTQLLHQLATNGETVIDLEELAKHKGSAFGNLERHEQPSQEMFENELGTALATAGDAVIWIEDESQRLGQLNIPGAFMRSIREKQLFFIDVPFEERLNYLVAGYGNCSIESLEAAILRIKKRLGHLNAKNAINFLLENNLKECFSILLNYYDKQYRKAMQEHSSPQKQVITIEAQRVDAIQNAGFLLPQQKA